MYMFLCIFIDVSWCFYMFLRTWASPGPCRALKWSKMFTIKWWEDPLKSADLASGIIVWSSLKMIGVRATCHNNLKEWKTLNWKPGAGILINVCPKNHPVMYIGKLFHTWRIWVVVISIRDFPACHVSCTHREVPVLDMQRKWLQLRQGPFVA